MQAKAFIELTRVPMLAKYQTDGRDERVLLDIIEIGHMYANANGTHIVFKSGRSITVEESYENVKDRISERMGQMPHPTE